MNDAYWLALLGAFALGLQTSISPCPLATNLAALAFVARRLDSPRNVLLSGVLYAVGRVAAYALFACLATSFALETGIESWIRWATVNLRGLLGPAIIFFGTVILGWVYIPIPGGANAEKARALVDKLGFWSAAPLGFLFAAAFCPTSAATFLATVALAIRFESPLLFSSVFGVATALPVALCAYILAFHANRLNDAFGFVGKIDKVSRSIFGTAAILLGVALTLRSTFGLF